MVGSVALLLSFLAIWLATHSFDFIQLKGMAHDGTLAAKLYVFSGGRTSV